MKISNDQFKILDTKTVFKSEKLQVDRARISLPNGNIDEWDTNVLPSFIYGVPIKDGQVVMTKEWRYGPNTILTQFTGTRCIFDDDDKNIGELKRELQEELGINGGMFEKVVSFAWGFRTTGNVTYFTVTDFNQGNTNRDENEIQDIISLPINGLFGELTKNHTVTSDTLLVAKLLEEKYSRD